MIEKNISLQAFNTFGFNETAEEFARFNSSDELTELLQNNKNKPLFILGGGSNILLTKKVEGLVLKNDIKGIKIIEENDDFVIVESGAGEIWHNFVLHCINQNWSGIENLSLIPGSVGASPMQNIGAYGVEIKDIFDYLLAYNLASGETEKFNAEQCQFGYRESIFKQALKGKYVICYVAFKLSKKALKNTTYGAIEDELKKMGIVDPSIQDISNAVIAIRQSKLPDPALIGNAGSFFKNPIVSETIVNQLKEKYPDIPNYPSSNGTKKLAAGWLIEQAGWKGKRFGNYGVHQKQALVLVNYGGGTGKDIYDLSTAIIDDIKTKFNVILEREVNIM
jgi:UDP-N-acetylmuramate dehydrogenase